ncbi:MAG: extracellular solute-binding protein [Candidatus Enteromonas sp.]
MPNKKTSIILALASMTILASCGAPGADDPSANSSDKSQETSEKTSESEQSTVSTPTEDVIFDPKEKVEITFWHTMGKQNQEYLDQMIAQFNTIYPNITVTHVQQGGYDEINNTINQNLATGNLPTMAYCYEDHVAGYIDHNAVLDMTPYINDSTYGLGHNPTGYNLFDGGVEDMTAGYWKAGSAYEQAGHYSMPHSKSTEALYYNKDVFEAHGWTVPKTWTEMWDLCETIMADPTYSENPDFYCLGYDSDANMLINLFEQNNLPYTTAAKDPVTESHFGFNTAANKKIVSDLKEYHDKRYLITKGSSANSAYTSTLFTASTCLMSIGSTGGTKYNYTENFVTGVSGVPQADLNAPKMLSQGPSICFFKRGTTPQQRTAAWLFYKWLNNTENSAYYASKTGYNPVRDSSYNSTFLTDDMANATGAEGLVRDTFHYVGDPDNGYTEGLYTSPAFKGSSEARRQMDGLLSSVLLGTKDVDKAFDDAMQACIFAE